MIMEGRPEHAVMRLQLIMISFAALSCFATVGQESYISGTAKMLELMPQQR